MIWKQNLEMILLLSSSDLLNKWESMPCDDFGQMRVDATHKLDLFISKNNQGHPLFYLLTRNQFSNIKSSHAIDVSILHREDGIYILKLELKKMSLFHEFIYLCHSLIECSRTDENESINVKSIITTFHNWQYLLDNSKDELLSDNSLKGLVGELSFILDNLNVKFPALQLLQAWTVRSNAERDFVFEDQWYEIKTIASASNKISITSIEQLDNDIIGELWVYKIDLSVGRQAYTFCVFDIINSIYMKLNTFEEESLFSKKLLQKGFVHNDLYSDILFLRTSKARYLIDNTFPKLFRRSICREIVDATYSLDIDMLHTWQIGE